MRESEIQSQVRLAAAPYAVLFRTNAGEFYQGQRVWSKEFGQAVLINLKRIEGLPKGYSDLSGVRKSDGKAVFFEVKTPAGKVRDDQERFIAAMLDCHAVAGVVRSAEDAVRLLQETSNE